MVTLQYTDCCVPQCNTRRIKNWDDDMSFHMFPSENRHKVFFESEHGKQLIDRREAWIKKLCINKPVSQYMKVCSLHFTSNDFFNKVNVKTMRRTLKKTAVPSKNLPTISEENNIQSLRRKRLSSKRCFVNGCENARTVTKYGGEGIVYYPIPKSTTLASINLRYKWIQFCGRDDIWDKKIGYVCSKHFKKSDFETDLKDKLSGSTVLKLKKNAIPSIHLPTSKRRTRRIKNPCKEQNKIKKENTKKKKPSQSKKQDQIEEKNRRNSIDSTMSLVDVELEVLRCSSPIEYCEQSSRSASPISNCSETTLGISFSNLSNIKNCRVKTENFLDIENPVSAAISSNNVEIEESENFIPQSDLYLNVENSEIKFKIKYENLYKEHQRLKKQFECYKQTTNNRLKILTAQLSYFERKFLNPKEGTEECYILKVV